MPNIVLTEYCNLKCPYCFASEMISEASQTNKNITEEQLISILDWLKPSILNKEINNIGLIGGEPLLHPNFESILHIINSFNSSTQSTSVIFTNGLLLNKYLHAIGQNMAILINVNKLKEDLEKKLINNLLLINKLNWFQTQKVTLGCNLHLDENNYDFFWKIVDMFPAIRHVRMSVTAPVNPIYKKNKIQYYTLMKPIFLSFFEEAKKRNIKISYDCNQIPLCFFEDETQYAILESSHKMTPGLFGYCSPVIDITPDFKATCCFGVYEPVDCKKFNNISELKRYFQYNMFLKSLNNNQDKCSQCEKLKLQQCQGGCLSFV